MASTCTVQVWLEAGAVEGPDGQQPASGAIWPDRIMGWEAAWREGGAYMPRLMKSTTSSSS